MDFEDRDARSHTYTLVLKPDNSYKVYVDLKEKSSGSLHDFWDYPKITMDDPSDEKPVGWVEQRRMVDPDSKKPKDRCQRVALIAQLRGLGGGAVHSRCCCCEAAPVG